MSALPKIIVTGYKELNLIYYFTAGETEVWLAVGCFVSASDIHYVYAFRCCFLQALRLRLCCLVLLFVP